MRTLATVLWPAKGSNQECFDLLSQNDFVSVYIHPRLYLLLQNCTNRLIILVNICKHWQCFVDALFFVSGWYLVGCLICEWNYFLPDLTLCYTVDWCLYYYCIVTFICIYLPVYFFVMITIVYGLLTGFSPESLPTALRFATICSDHECCWPCASFWFFSQWFEYEDNLRSVCYISANV